MENKQNTAPNITSSKHPCKITILSNGLQYNTIQYRTMQNNVILFNAMQIKLIQVFVLALWLWITKS